MMSSRFACWVVFALNGLLLFVSPSRTSLGAGPENVITNSIGMKLTRIPAGEFLMGSPASDTGAQRHEKPQHKVRITKPFYLGVYEVTQAEYEQVMGENPSDISKGGNGANRVPGKNTSNYPKQFVNWNDAVEFCRKLSELPEEKAAKQMYRLPTEAEWEYACRAGTTTRYSFGDGKYELGEYAWFRENSEGTTRNVGQKKPNVWGLHDMHGNVWEWCADRWANDYYEDSPTDDPQGASGGSNRVFRGGSWYDTAAYCRSAYRLRVLPMFRFNYLGFRVARVPFASEPVSGSESGSR
ncbi:MAG: formylglycine-generating enzyme family protein [Pirellulaceae bacterium]